MFIYAIEWVLHELCGQVRENESTDYYEIAGTLTNATSQCSKWILLVHRLLISDIILILSTCVEYIIITFESVWKDCVVLVMGVRCVI